MEALVLILIIIILVLLFKRTFSSVIYATVMVDIALRLITFFTSELKIPCTLPVSLNGVITNFTTGIIQKVLLWTVFGVYVMFMFYTVRIFIRKK